MSEYTMQAGRDLDALVAEKVMGYKLAWAYPAPIEHGGRIVDYKSVAGDGTQPNSYRTYPNTIGSCYASEPDNVPEYSTDIAAAWQVVEKFGLGIEPHRYGEDGVVKEWRVIHRQKSGKYFIANTAPLAICLAALKAMEAT